MFWTRSELKQRAKDVLRRNYWKAFIVSLVIAVALGSSSSPTNSVQNIINDNTQSNYSDALIIDQPINEFYEITGVGQSSISSILLLASGIVAALFGVGILVIRILLCYHLEVGGRKFFVQAALGEDNMSYLGWGFKSGRYGSVLGVMFMRDLFIFLWTLLFIIPGVIKGYAYRMVPYILTENPHIGYKRALELSKTMTNGHKANMFLLDLSFVGWLLLGFLGCCVGVFFVRPYIDATDAELYLELRKNALDMGFTGESELCPRIQ